MMAYSSRSSRRPHCAIPSDDELSIRQPCGQTPTRLRPAIPRSRATPPRGATGAPTSSGYGEHVPLGMAAGVTARGVTAIPAASRGSTHALGPLVTGRCALPGADPRTHYEFSVAGEILVRMSVTRLCHWGSRQSSGPTEKHASPVAGQQIVMAVAVSSKRGCFRYSTSVKVGRATGNVADAEHPRQVVGGR
jgi:hypothetical protein